MVLGGDRWCWVVFVRWCWVVLMGCLMILAYEWHRVLLGNAKWCCHYVYYVMYTNTVYPIH